MKVLVVGASGATGRLVVKQLLSRGVQSLQSCAHPTVCPTVLSY
jgi:putative NADH-flavin reductase